MKLPLAILTALSLSLRCWSAETRLLECPVSLTNPDGQALDLERCDVRTAVHGPLALVEMEMTFRNPQPRQMEGRFLYLLPPGATVSRFAKEVDGKLMEGEVVERMRAQRIFTEILHTMRDPALLEQDQGNRFAGLKDPYQATVIRAGNYQMTAYRPETAVIGKAEPMGWCFYIDTSASGADMEQRRLDAINHLYPKTLTDKGTTRVWAYDLDVVPVLSQAANQNWIPEGYIPPEKGLQQFLRTRHCLGATNLEAALKHIGDQARCAERPTRFVLVSDGIATFGAREPRELIAALGEWPEQHVLHALVLGPKQDAKTLSAIVEKTNGRVVTVSLGSDMEKSVERAVVELQRPVGASFEFYDEGAEWIFPKSFRDVGPGDEMVLFSRVKDGAAAKPGVIQRNALGNVVKDQPLTAPPREAPAFAPLFEREACAAYLNHLEKLEQETVDQAKIAELRKQRIDVSVKHRVLCPLTSLLVLETEQDYARFGIDRKALADVMVVGNKGIELRHRTAED